MARQGQAGDESEREHERGPAQFEPVEHPPDEQERGDDPEADGHREKRDAETCLLREGLQIAVRKVGDRQLKRVRGAEDEGRDADVDDEERCDDADEVHAPLEQLRNGASQHHETDDERPDQQRESAEQRPPRHVVTPRRARGADGLGRWRGIDADPEREDTGRGVSIVPDHPPAHGVRRLVGETRHGRDDDVPVAFGPRSAGEHAPVGSEYLDRALRDGHRQVEDETDLPRRRLEPRLRLGLRALERDVRERDSTARREPPRACRAG